MGTFLKVIGVASLCLVGGCIFLGIVGGLAARNVANDPEFQKTVEQFTPQPAETLTVDLAKFNRIQTGMTYAQVIEIIGENGTMDSENDIAGIHTVMYSWKNKSFADGGMNAMFQDDKLIQKSQFMLK